MFTLAISCLTTYNLPWFRDLTFQALMQYCSLQHQTLLPSPVTSTTGRFFHFGSVSSFFLELFLPTSPVAYWSPTDLGSSSFSVISFCLYTVHVVLGWRILKWIAIPFSSGSRFVRTLHHDPSILGGPTRQGSWFKGLDLIDRVPEELWTEVRDIIQEAVIKTIPKTKKCEKAKWLSQEAL